MSSILDQYEIPLEPVPPVTSPDRYSMLLYGNSKVGKSKLCSLIPNHFILGCQPGNLDHLTARYVYIKDYPMVLDVLNAIDDGEIKCDAVIIDEIDKLYDMCTDYFRPRYRSKDYPQGITSPEQRDPLDFWNVIRKSFRQFLFEFTKLKKTRIFTCNEMVESHEELIGERSRIGLACTDQLKKLLTGKFTLRARISTDMAGCRHLEVEGHTSLDAGNGYSNHFNWEGRRLRKFSLGTSPEFCYQMFLAAFNNELKGEVI